MESDSAMVKAAPNSFMRPFGRMFSSLLQWRKEHSQAYLNDHLIKRKYILSRVSEHVGKDKFEPAPLLNLNILQYGDSLDLAAALALRGAEMTYYPLSDITVRTRRADAMAGTDVNITDKNPTRLYAQGQTYDVIICCDSLSQSAEPARLMWEFEHLLNPQGIIIIGDWEPYWRSIMWQAVFGIRRNPRTFLRWPRGYRLIHQQNLQVHHQTYIRFSSAANDWLKVHHRTGRWLAAATRATT